MKNDMKLITPTIDDLWFRKEIKEDPKTMDYNTGYDVNFKGYNYYDGTIQTDIDDLKNNWFKKFIGNWPQTFYSYIENDGILIGEVYAKWDESRLAYEIGIIIKGEYRGKGYSTKAIGLLVEKLKSLGAKNLYHDIPECRKAAIKADLNNGFIIVDRYEGMKKFKEPEIHVVLELKL